MKKYLGVKLIEAEECARQCGTEGYKVIYEDGYESWSPKDVFEEAYRKVKTFEDIKGVVIKNPYQSRVYSEIQELAGKIKSLENFINDNPEFPDLDNDEKIRLKQQLMAMQYYLTILIERIENFK